MRIEIISVSGKQPPWVQAGFNHYAKRFSGGWSLTLREVPLARRAASRTTAQALVQEGERMLAAAPKGAHLVALEERGRPWSTAELADRLQVWAGIGQPVALLVGGPDGLAADCLAAAPERWSLSGLTLPHGLVRIVVAEAVYRAWSLNRGHPYHRA